ncbi:hypothetical protein [Mesorhizobium temperatum]|uniref:hypothetical protein n=1 Tax=Mesorhizobium temperatum TaxID=241416 RepID=UPI00142E7341|nr:hypothetical protein [Mesorhizobium temperatum]
MLTAVGLTTSACNRGHAIVQPNTGWVLGRNQLQRDKVLLDDAGCTLILVKAN